MIQRTPIKPVGKKFNKIKKEFPNVFMLGRDWTKQQLGMIAKSLRLTRNAFGGQQGFVNGLGNFSILKANLFGKPGMAPPGLNTIFLDVSTFSKEYESVLYTIIHEIGHIFDFRGWGDRYKYKSDMSVNNYSPFYSHACDMGYFGCVSENSIYTFNPGGANYGWNPEEEETTLYGLNASIEDFADSFAIYVMEIGGRDAPFSVSEERKINIAVWIDMAKK